MSTKSTCRYCNSTIFEFKYEVTDIFGDTYSMVQCIDCRAYFLSPLPTPEQLQKAYAPSYYGDNDKKFKPVFENVMDFFRNQRAKMATKYLPENGKILDIGCGNGGFLASVHKRGKYQLFGIEMDGKAAQRAQQHPEINLTIGAFNSTSFPNHSFDLITLFHVFEHLENPSETLDSIGYLVKKDGYLIISFPNIASRQSRRFTSNWLHLDPPRHLQFFEPKDFISIMGKRGFQLVKEDYFSIEQNPYGLIQSTLNRWGIKRDLLFESMKGNQDYIADYPKWKLKFQKLFFMMYFAFGIIIDCYESFKKKGATVLFIFQKK
ncbi:MAG: class I SAM-dependent methyltransferase [Bacteroidota bacterium]